MWPWEHIFAIDVSANALHVVETFEVGKVSISAPVDGKTT